MCIRDRSRKVHEEVEDWHQQKSGGTLKGLMGKVQGKSLPSRSSSAKGSEQGDDTEKGKSAKGKERMKISLEKELNGAQMAEWQDRHPGVVTRPGKGKSRPSDEDGEHEEEPGKTTGGKKGKAAGRSGRTSATYQ